MNNTLTKITAHKKEEVAQQKKIRPLSSFHDQPPLPIRNFIASLETFNPAIIAEIKKASPSKGVIRADFDVEEIAKTYEKYGARCLSVLTEKTFFQGDPTYLLKAKHQCALPILRKDFIVDAYQIYESRALGADCILLIVAILTDGQLKDFCELAQNLGMAVLVESHTHEELERALALPTPLIGINNRCLQSFKTDLEQSIRLKHYVPKDKITISESGIHSPTDIRRLQTHGIQAFLIGEGLMRADDIGLRLKEMIGS